MINVSKIQDSLIGIVGFRQPANPDYAVLDAENTASKSGYFVNDNPFAKIEYLKDNNDFSGISDENFNAFLLNKQRSSISNVCNQIFSNADFIDRSLLFSNAFNKTETENLPNGFVGFRIIPDIEKNRAVKISRVLLDFEGTGNIELILWNSAKKTPLFTKSVTINSDHQEVILDWTIDNSDTTYKGEYYIGYLSTDLTVQPFKRDYQNGSVMNELTGLFIEKVCVPNHDSNTLFNLDNVVSLNETTGLNLDITVYEDFTDLAINNSFLLGRAIYLDMVISCLQVYISSLRSNMNERESANLYQKVMIEIEGTDQGIQVKGLRSQLLSEITSIKQQIEKIREGYFGIGYEVITQD